MSCVSPSLVSCATPRARAAGLIAALALGALVPRAAPAQAAWPDTLYNPKPRPDDVLLPMPCGGQMALRKVLVPSTGVLDDRRVRLGSPDPAYGYMENTRTEYVAGSFVDAKVKNQRFFLIGKYEVTRAQYDALAGACAAPGSSARMPKTALTWDEAVAFTGRYSEWLVKNAAAELRTKAGAAAFVRLPTEAEWEYTARGGIAVENAVFEQPVFPMAEGAAKYVWSEGNESSNNELNNIGLLLPNPLGVHDILGNAGEFVLDAFRLNKHSHMHGQAGGATIKGGDFRTRLSEMRASARAEYVPVTAAGARRDDATGLRVAIVSAAMPSLAGAAEIQKAWSEAAAQGGGEGSPIGTQPLADPVQEIEALAKLSPDPAMKQRLAGIGSVIKAGIQARNEQRDRAAKAQVQVGTYLAGTIGRDVRRLEAVKAAAAATGSAAAEPTLRAAQAQIDDNLLYLIDTVRQIGLDFPAASITQQADVLKREFEARGRGKYGVLIDLVVGYAQRSRNGARIDKAALAREVAGLVP